MNRSIVHRITLPAPECMAAPTPAARRPDEALSAANAAQGVITEQILVIRRAVAEVTAGQTLPGSDAELEEVVIDDAMLADAREKYLRPRGHLTRRLTSGARETRAATVDEVIRVRFARRPFATAQARVRAVVQRGRHLHLEILSGPDTGRWVDTHLGLAFPWDVLV